MEEREGEREEEREGSVNCGVDGETIFSKGILYKAHAQPLQLQPVIFSASTVNKHLIPSAIIHAHLVTVEVSIPYILDHHTNLPHQIWSA